GKLRALAVTTSARAEGFPDLPNVGDFLPGLPGQHLVRHLRAQQKTPRRHPKAPQKKKSGANPGQNKGKNCGAWRCRCFAVHPTSFAASSPKKPRNGPG